MKGMAIFGVLIEGHHYVLHDELFQLLHLTIYNNTNVYPPNNSRISQKIFSNEYTAKLPSNFMVSQCLFISINTTFYDKCIFRINLI